MIKPQIPKNEKQRQLALESYTILDSLSEELFDDLTLIASQICDTPIALISLIDNDRQWFKSKVGLSINETSRDISFCGHAINEPNTTFEVQDAKLDPRFAGNPLVTDNPNIGFYAGSPLVDAQNNVLGTLCVIDETPRKLTEKQKKALEALSREVMYRISSRKKKIQLNNEVKTSEEQLKILQQNNYRYESLIEFAPLGIAVSDLKGKMLQTNAVFEKMMGYSKEELKKISVANLTHPDDIEETKLNMGKLRNGEFRSFTLEKRYFNKNKEIIWGRVSSSFVVNSEGKPEYLIATLEDITQRKKLEEDYRFHMERLDLAVKGTNDGLWDRFDINSNEEWWSPRFYELIGYKEGEIEPTLDNFKNRLLHPDDSEHALKAVDDCLTKFIPIDVEYRLKTKSGAFKWFRERGNVTRNSEGEPIRMTGSISDIDHSKKTTLKLEEAEKFQSKVTSIAPSIIYVFNQRTMSNEYANRELWSVMGLSEKEAQALGANLMPTLCHPDDLPFVFEHFGKIQKMKDDETLQLEYRMKHKDGDYRWLLSIDAVFERDIDGSVLKHIGIASDITELKKSQMKLEKQAKALEKKNQKLEQLAYVATHDLKVPILDIDGHFKYVKTKLLKDDDAKVSADFIDDSIQQFQHTIKGLTEAIKLDKEEIDRESIEMIDFCGEMFPIFKRQLNEVGGVCRFNHEGSGTISASRVYLNSIFQNLVSNAIKYRELERELEVIANFQVIKNDLHIKISDNGIGIDLDLNKDKMFTMFSRFNAKIQGLGMGLYMVKNMVESMDGEIEVESQLGVGTTFHLKFRLNS